MQKFWIHHEGEVTPIFSSSRSEAVSAWLRQYEDKHALAIAKESKSFVVTVFSDSEYEDAIFETGPWDAVLHYGQAFEVSGKLQPQYKVKKKS